MKLLLLFFGIVVAAESSELLLNEFAVGSTQFAVDVYKELREVHSGNFVVCPLSTEIILALVANGAKGTTSQQITSRLHLPKDKTKINAMFRLLTPHLHSNDLTSANKLYVKNNLELNTQFKNTAIHDFDSQIQNINFKKGSEAASEINAWVADKTHGLNKNVINGDELDASTAMVLINALSFRGKWKVAFDEETSKKIPFFVSSSIQVYVNMMRMVHKFNYLEDSRLNAKFLELPYEGGELTMTIVVPNDVNGLPALEHRIGDVLVATNFKREKVEVKIPKFRTETTIKFDPILKELGIVDAFQNNADFSGISSDKEPLKISKVVQKNVLEVKEAGTTVTSGSRSLGSITVRAKKFIADRPFIYYIKSKSAGILFVGRFMQPMTNMI